MAGPIDNGPNWSKAKRRSGNWLVTCSVRSSFGVLVRVRRLLPGPGPPEGDLPGVEDLPDPLLADRDCPDGRAPFAWFTADEADGQSK